MTIDERLQPIVRELVKSGLPLRLALKEFEKKLIDAALLETKGNVTKAARMLGVHRNTLLAKRKRDRRWAL